MLRFFSKPLMLTVTLIVIHYCDDANSKINKGYKLAYGLGQASEGIKNAAFNVFIFFYYSQVLGLSAATTGIAVFIALVFDAFTDPMTGSISDNFRSRWGRRHPFLFIAAVPLGLCLFALFSPPALSQVGLFVWLTFFAVLTRLAITLVYVPHVALGAELSSDFHERTTIVSYRFFFSYVGHLLTYFIGFAIFFADSADGLVRGQFKLDAYVPFGATLAVIISSVVLVSALGTKHRIPYLVQPAQRSQSGSVADLFRKTLFDLKSSLSNRSFRWLFAGVLIIFTMVGVDAALNLHMNTFFWELQSSGNLWFFMATPLGALAGTFIARKLNVKFDKKPSIVFGTLWWAGCQIVPVVLRLVGWFPENGTSELLSTLIIIKFLQGVGVIQALITFNSMVADIVDEHELTSGQRQEGIFFAAVSFSNKVTTGLGAVVAGYALTLIAWPTGAMIQSAADVPPATIMWLGLLYGPIVSGFAVVCVYCYSQYDLDKPRHDKIVAELARRRGGGDHASALGERSGGVA